jgi:hypothetical protein
MYANVDLGAKVALFQKKMAWGIMGNVIQEPPVPPMKEEEGESEEAQMKRIKDFKALSEEREKRIVEREPELLEVACCCFSKP